MKKLLLFPFTVLALLIGRFSWSAPPWLTSLDRLAKTYHYQVVRLHAMVMNVIYLLKSRISNCYSKPKFCHLHLIVIMVTTELLKGEINLLIKKKEHIALKSIK